MSISKTGLVLSGLGTIAALSQFCALKKLAAAQAKVACAAEEAAMGPIPDGLFFLFAPNGPCQYWLDMVAVSWGVLLILPLAVVTIALNICQFQRRIEP